MLKKEDFAKMFEDPQLRVERQYDSDCDESESESLRITNSHCNGYVKGLLGCCGCGLLLCCCCAGVVVVVVVVLVLLFVVHWFLLLL